MLRVRPANRDPRLQASRGVEPALPDLPQPRPSPDEPIVGRQFIAGGRVVFLDDPRDQGRGVQAMQLPCLPEGSSLFQISDGRFIQDPDARAGYIWDFPPIGDECR